MRSSDRSPRTRTRRVDCLVRTTRHNQSRTPSTGSTQPHSRIDNPARLDAALRVPEHPLHRPRQPASSGHWASTSTTPVSARRPFDHPNDSTGEDASCQLLQPIGCHENPPGFPLSVAGLAPRYPPDHLLHQTRGQSPRAPKRIDPTCGRLRCRKTAPPSGPAIDAARTNCSQFVRRLFDGSPLSRRLPAPHIFCAPRARPNRYRHLTPRFRATGSASAAPAARTTSELASSKARTSTAQGAFCLRVPHTDKLLPASVLRAAADSPALPPFAPLPTRVRASLQYARPTTCPAIRQSPKATCRSSTSAAKNPTSTPTRPTTTPMPTGFPASHRARTTRSSPRPRLPWPGTHRVRRRHRVLPAATARCREFPPTRSDPDTPCRFRVPATT